MWHKRFSEGRDTIKDDPRTGRKKTKRCHDVVASVRSALEEDRRLNIRQLCEMFDLGYGTVQRILTSDLKMSKVHARWVPRLLKDEEKERRMSDSKLFLRQYSREGDDFLNSLITTDEIWLWLYDPETKSQSAVWQQAGSPPPEKARVNKCGGKYMFIMFADRKGMILTHVVPNTKTVNASYYSKVLRRHLLRALRKKRPGVPVEKFILHQDNASPHTATETTLEIGLTCFRTVKHPPYSPDLAPMDFAFFPTIKSQLKGKRFSSLNELKVEVNAIISRYDGSWYCDIYDKWIDRHKKCIACDGEYFEKK